MTPRSVQHRTPPPSRSDARIRTIIVNLITTSAAVAVFLWLESQPAPWYYAAGAALAVLVLGAFVSMWLAHTKGEEIGAIGPTNSAEPRSRTRLTILASALHSSPSIRVTQVKRTAARLGDVENELIRRITERYPTDRRMRSLMAELQICSSRMKAQLNDCCLNDCATMTSRETISQN